MSKVKLTLTLSMADMEPTPHEYEAEFKEMGNISRVSFVPVDGAEAEHLDFFRDDAGKLIRVRRTGGSGLMVFEMYESLEGHIRTVAGDYPVKTYTNRMNETRTEGHFCVDLRYRLCLGLVDRGVCELKIEIR